MVTTTTVYGFQKPAVAGDEDAWGGYLNANIDKYESILTGNTTITSLVITTADINGGTLDNVVIGGSTAAAVTGTTITGTSFVSSGNMTFGDSNKAIFGAGSDLQIYHDGSNSYMLEGGTGSLILGGTNLYLANGDNSKAFLRGTNNADVALYYNNSIKLTTTSTGIDVTGTVTADGLTVEGTDDVALIRTNQSNYTEGLTLRNTANWGYGTSLSFEAITSSGGSNAEVGRITSVWNTTGYHGLDFYTLNNNTLLRHMRLDGYGDFSLYEDTGTTAKFFWDASAESLGIGTSSPERPLHISANPPIILLEDTGGGTDDKRAQIHVDTGVFQIKARNDDNSNRTDILTADLGTGNVGLGTTSPTAVSSYKVLHLKGGATNNGGMIRLDTSDASAVGRIYAADALYFDTTTSSAMIFKPNNSEAMRIDSSGKIGVGTTLPSDELTVVGNQQGSDVTIRVQNSDTLNASSNSRLRLTTPYNEAYIAAYTGLGGSGYLVFANENAERMRIDSSGRVMIGTSSASYPFTVQSTGTSTVHIKTTATNGAAQLRLENDAKAYAVGVGSSDQLYIYDNTNGANRIVVDTNGNVGINKGTPSSYQSYRYLEVAGVSSGQGGVIQIMTSGLEARGQWAVDSSGVRLLAVTNHNLSFFTNGSERMTIASYGSVGIGTSTPTNFSTFRYLDIMGSATTTGGVIQLLTSDLSANMLMYSSSSGGVLGTATNHNLFFITNNSGKMVLDTSGNLLVGKTSTGTINSGAMDFTAGVGTYLGVLNINHSTTNVSGSGFINFARDTAYIGSITQNGTTGVSYNTSSDHRLKENVVELTGATARLKQLEPKRFNFIADADTTVDGFLAHEVQSVVPEAITGTHNEVDADGNPVYQGIDQSKLVPLLVATIKELEARITALEGE